MTPISFERIHRIALANYKCSKCEAAITKGEYYYLCRSVQEDNKKKTARYCETCGKNAVPSFKK